MEGNRLCSQLAIFETMTTHHCALSGRFGQKKQKFMLSNNIVQDHLITPNPGGSFILMRLCACKCEALDRHLSGRESNEERFPCKRSDPSAGCGKIHLRLLTVPFRQTSPQPKNGINALKDAPHSNWTDGIEELSPQL